jgi:integrase
MLQFWFNTGLRPGELIALQWPKIDLETRRSRIDLNLVSGVVKGPKTVAGVRDVELNNDAISALLAQQQFTFASNQHVWHNPRTGAPWGSDAQIRKTLWEPLCMRSGVRYRNPYQVRHTYASMMLTSGTNPWYVAQQLGHVDVQMVFKVYGKFISQDYQRPRAVNELVVPEAGRDAQD